MLAAFLRQKKNTLQLPLHAVSQSLVPVQGRASTERRMRRKQCSRTAIWQPEKVSPSSALLVAAPRPNGKFVGILGLSP